MDEFHHAFLVSEYYRLLLERFGARGLAVFTIAARAYGEQRGRRMAMRAAADGHALDFEGYFAYAEYRATAAYFDVDMRAEAGAIHECVTRCPWAEAFAERDLRHCGAAYCREIDMAVLRGFNPELRMETISTQHYEGSCRFRYGDEAVTPELLTRAAALTADRTDVRMPLAYHCAHVYAAFRQTAGGVFGAEGRALARDVADAFAARYGGPAREQLLSGADRDFDTIE